MSTALEAWKAGMPSASLMSGTPAVEFFDDDWSNSVSLVEFAIRKTYLDPDGSARCTVELTLRSAASESTRVEVTYQVVLKEQRLVVARDPYS